MKHDTALRLAKTERCRFLVEGLDLEAATGLEHAEWEAYQIAHLNDDGLFRHDVKSRQIGWSWLTAAEAVANSMLIPGNTSLFVSINREESAEKIRYARDIYDALYPEWRVALTNDNITGQGYANKSRIVSQPQRPVRGKSRSWVYLDEFAHYRLDKPIYIGTLPVTTKGGKIRIGSTPMGARGMFWEIGEQTARRYPGYTRSKTPWWEATALLRAGVSVRLAALTAPHLAPEEAVERFGNQRIQDIFANMPLDDFCQEYACQYVDEVSSYIPWDDIFGCTAEDGALTHSWNTKTPEDALFAIDDMAAAVADGKMNGALVWGLDIGRKRDLTELVIVEVTATALIVRANLSLDRQMFETQYQICRHLLDSLPTAVRGYMDQNGLGMQLSETLHMRDGYSDRAMPMPFTNATKTLMATHIKTRFQRRGRRGSLIIPPDRDLAYQIHSIRRRITPGGNTVFDVEQSERHHADKFWALAAAVEAAETLSRIEDYPAGESVTLTTARRMDTFNPQPYAPDLAINEQGFASDDMSRMIEGGVLAALPAMVILQLPEHLRAALLPAGLPPGLAQPGVPSFIEETLNAPNAPQEPGPDDEQRRPGDDPASAAGPLRADRAATA